MSKTRLWLISLNQFQTRQIESRQIEIKQIEELVSLIDTTNYKAHKSQLTQCSRLTNPVKWRVQRTRKVKNTKLDIDYYQTFLYFYFIILYLYYL